MSFAAALFTVTQAAQGPPEPSPHDQTSEHPLDRAQGLPQKDCPQESTIEGERVVEDHGTACPQDLDGAVPAPEGHDSRNDTDMDDG